VVAGLADTLQVMYAGYIVERGPNDDVFSDTRHPYTLGLLGSLPRMDQKGEKLFSIEGAPPDLRVLPTGCPFAPRCHYRIDKCLVEVPSLKPVDGGAPGHVVACWVDVREGVPTE
jgi:oligopeptide/dipeptide ABC transporter ATP-binding protein